MDILVYRGHAPSLRPPSGGRSLRCRKDFDEPECELCPAGPLSNSPHGVRETHVCGKSEVHRRQADEVTQQPFSYYSSCQIHSAVKAAIILSFSP